jgi:hypothetical protein
MTIENLMEKFLQIDGAAAGNGPRHPVQPDPSAEIRISSFLDTYPFLHQDPCYRDFLEVYAGAAINSSDENDLVDILGFSDVSPDIEYFEGPVVSSNGFLVFAICAYYRHTEQQLYMYEHDFAFDASGTRKPGIYRMVSALDQEPSAFTWYIGDFCSWLEDLIDKGGVYERPSSS